MPLNRQDLELIDSTRQVVIETRSADRVYRTVIWVVVDQGMILVRSVRGGNGRWYQRASADPRVALDVGGSRFDLTAIPVTDAETIEMTSDALRRKYPKGGSLDSMLRPEVLDTTFHLEPRS